MTYPPQPEQPHGQQAGGFPPQAGQPGFPDPSGNPQSGGFPQSGYPQSGGFPQGGYPQNFPPGGYSDQFGQPAPGQADYPGFGQPGYSGFGQPGGFGAPPEEPPKSKKGLWIGLTVAIVVILAAVGVTGFVVPGFFLAKSESSTPQKTLQAITDGLNKHDQAALHATVCQDGNPRLGDAISEVDAVSDAKIASGPTKVSDTEYNGGLDLKYNGTPEPITVNLAKENDTWCWKDASDSPSPAPSGG